MSVGPTDTRGFERVRNIPGLGGRGAGWMSHAEVRFTDCRVPMSHRIGEEGAGFRLAQERLNEITGEFTADDLLGVIFSRFCIGE